MKCGPARPRPAEPGRAGPHFRPIGPGFSWRFGPDFRPDHSTSIYLSVFTAQHCIRHSTVFAVNSLSTCVFLFVCHTHELYHENRWAHLLTFTSPSGSGPSICWFSETKHRGKISTGHYINGASNSVRRKKFTIFDQHFYVFRKRLSVRTYLL